MVGMATSRSHPRIHSRIPETMRKLALLLGGLMLVMLPVAMSAPQLWVQARTESGDVVVCLAANRSDTVQVQFTHSMYGGYVREIWRITPGGALERERFVTENAAAAEYYATDGTSYRADDGYVVSTDSLMQPELVIRVNERGNHILTVGDHSVNLADAVDRSAQVRISVSTESCPESALTGILERTHQHARSAGRHQ